MPTRFRSAATFFAAVCLSLLPLIVTPAAHAQLTLTLSPSLVTARPGTTATYKGTLTNNFTSAVFLISSQGSWLQDSTPATINTESFLTYSPLSIAAGASYTGSIFDVMIDPTAPLNSEWAGRFSVNYNFTSVNDPEIAATPFADFLLDVTLIPEPGSGTLLLSGVTTALLLFGTVKLARRKRQSAPCYQISSE